MTVEPEKKVIVALTNARLIRKKRSGFDQKSREIFQNINENSGYIGGSVRFRLWGDDVYTMTVWESLEDMQRFVNGRRHTDA